MVSKCSFSIDINKINLDSSYGKKRNIPKTLAGCTSNNNKPR